MLGVAQYGSFDGKDILVNLERNTSAYLCKLLKTDTTSSARYVAPDA